MISEYQIEGMTCEGCVATVKRIVEQDPSIQQADIQLKYPQARLVTDHTPDLAAINQLLQQTGGYSISPITQTNKQSSDGLPEKSATTYKPLILIVIFISGTSALSQFQSDAFSWMLWMRHFMAGFFIVFSFFKFLNLKGFANSYAMYDLLAGRWGTWGYVYPFIELSLGIFYLIDIAPQVTNWATIIVLGFSSIGVIKSNLDRRKIKCACLGDVFNLPMSVVTIIEDLLMVGMAAVMLVL